MADAGGGFCVGSLAVPYFRMGVHTIIGAGRFHFRGRDGIGWGPPAMAARQFVARPRRPAGAAVFGWRARRWAGRRDGLQSARRGRLGFALKAAPPAPAGRLGVIWPSLTGN